MRRRGPKTQLINSDIEKFAVVMRKNMFSPILNVKYFIPKLENENK